MPCLNEVQTLGRCIQKARQFLDEYGVAGEVLIADNGSDDGSQEVARRMGARVINVAQRGYGAALHKGARSALGTYVVMGDADDSYDFSRLEPFLTTLRAGADLVMGNRFRGGIAPGAMPWKNRYLGNPVLSGLGRMLFRAGVHDFHCGLRAFSRQAFARMDLVTTGMEFASEMVIKATLLGMRVEEVPTTLDRDGRERPPHLRPWRDGWRHLRFMLLYSPQWLFFIPGVALILVGSVAAALLARDPIIAGRFYLDVHTLLYAVTAAVIGFQLVLFAVFARVLAAREGLIPPSPRFDWLFTYVTLETGLVAGVVMLLVGLFGALDTILMWRATEYGSLSTSETMRVAIPSMALLMLGAQTVFGSFFLSMLGLRTRNGTRETEQ